MVFKHRRLLNHFHSKAVGFFLYYVCIFLYPVFWTIGFFWYYFCSRKTFPGTIFDSSLLWNKTQWFLELQKTVIFIAKPLSFPGTSFDPSLLCNKMRWFLELQKRVIFIAKPWSFLRIIFGPSLLYGKTQWVFIASKESDFHGKTVEFSGNYVWPESLV